jgi:uncharacterized protein (DUF934 family)
MSPKKYYTFMIDPELAEALKVVKERDHIPESQQIRLALREWMEERGVMKADRKRVATRKRS